MINKRLNLKITAMLFITLACLFYRGLSYLPPDIDHAKVIKGLNSSTLKKGKDIYLRACVTCHGKDGTASLPQARSFNKDRLRFGNRPYDMWKTITYGAGMMAAQTWLSPSERYYVIQYIREEFMKKSNPRQYFRITEDYLAKLPKSQQTINEQLAETKRQALKGSLKYGQEWFMHNESDYGNAIYSQLQGMTTAALNVQLNKDVLISYDLLRMGTAGVWKGKLNLSDTKYKRYRGEGEPFIQGTPVPGLQLWQWTYNGQLDSLNKTTGIRSPLAETFLRYNGHYKYGKDIILSYAVSGREVLEHPRLLQKGNMNILSHTLSIAAGKEQKIFIGQLEGINLKKGVMLPSGKFSADSMVRGENIITVSSRTNNITGRFVAVAIVTEAPGLTWTIDKRNRMVLTIPASRKAETIKVLRVSGKGDSDLKTFATLVAGGASFRETPDLTAMIKGGPALWQKTVHASGELNASKPHFDPRYYEDEDKTIQKKLVTLPADYPYTVDNIGLPFDNAYNAWVRPAALGFMSDGRLVFTTYTGDVWMGTGIDSLLNNISWQRIASGLYEPMGMKVIKDQIYVTCRNGIMILRDLNGDQETDFYENFHSDHDVSRFFHAFNFGLETDTDGNIYYVKPGQYTDNKDPGNVIRVSPDGKKWESIATGFRVDNGITITPENKIFVSDNQGNWTPANKINYIEKGKYYGYVPNITESGWSPDGKKFDKKDVVNNVVNPAIVPVPDTFQAPALWMPQEFDNSPGGGVWSPASWGPLGNQFIHTSYGTGWMYHFIPHDVDGVAQAAMVALPFQFDAGIQRAAVNPVDKQIYVAGLTGWDDGVASKYGVLARVRYRGGEGHFLKDAKVVRNGIKLHFNFALDTKAAPQAGDFEVTRWNYKRTSRYGSAHYSLQRPGEEGEDSVFVKEVVVEDEGRSLLLVIPELSLAHTMRIRFNLRGADGATLKDAVYMTVNKIPG